MTEQCILYIHFKILEQTCGNKSSFCIFNYQKKKKKKVDAARFLDARGDEKQVIYLERPNGDFHLAMSTKSQSCLSMFIICSIICVCGSVIL